MHTLGTFASPLTHGHFVSAAPLGLSSSIIDLPMRMPRGADPHRLPSAAGSTLGTKNRAGAGFGTGSEAGSGPAAIPSGDPRLAVPIGETTKPAPAAPAPTAATGHSSAAAAALPSARALQFHCPNPGRIGTLSARYESGGRGAAAIGYDNTGGWSYGKYQIETQRGTMAKFFAYLKSDLNGFNEALLAAGGLDAAKSGTATFKAAWIKAARDPRFEALQHGFIEMKNYRPLANKVIVDTGINPFTRSAAFRDVVWSVAVQHGPAASVITRALATLHQPALADDAVLINAIYDERGAELVGKDGKKTLKYFSKSTLDVQAGVRKRMLQERHCALHMLNVEKQHLGTKTR